jgi:CubicO group peptidase (beta-lactamase class C family)
MRIDDVLRAAVDAREIPGVVAMAATHAGVLYEGAFPGAPVRWGLGHMLNMQPGPDGRRAGTVSWGGLYNSYYWLDPAARVAGVILMQILPFADARAVSVYGRFERAVYDAARA